MGKELATKTDIAKQHDLSIIEQVVMQGDLSKLNPIQRVTYYNTVCESLGLNPYTKPFDYISLKGKLTLYAKKDATEQLRAVKNISITDLEGRMVDDLYIVRAKATMPNGRTDQSTGAVSIGNLRGEEKANAIMKAETKAKRRVTLSISGLGWTDESELETIPHVKHVSVDLKTGEIDGHEKPSLSYNEQAQVKVSPTSPCLSIVEPIETPPLVPKDSKAFDEFVARHSLIKNPDGTATSRKMLYIIDTCKKANMSEQKVIESAYNHEALFIERFHKWHDQNYPKDQPIQGTTEPVGMEIFSM